MHALSKKGLTSFFAIVTAIIVTACTSSSGTGASTGIEDQVAGGDPAGATIAFAQPTPGSTVSIPFEVALDSSVPLGEPETGNNHAHIYFDTGTDAPDYDIVYGTSAQVTRDLAPGEHTITVALANPDHSLAGPTQSITIQIGVPGASGEAPAASGEAPPATASEPPPPPGY